ncbi:Uncharacterized conserved protein [Phaffia rhodozyma]|uniref:Protein arginine methyltransferase NDUFAF7 n=1 Tax=Phaffia rhodozyma TaxID=264483 RepID=A0A0F7SQA8_PHARH|nr:Uncharacterized conserved protein [Phaffia rhodozyma]
MFTILRSQKSSRPSRVLCNLVRSYSSLPSSSDVSSFNSFSKSAASALDVDTTRSFQKPPPTPIPEDDTPLGSILRKTIDAAGPMPLARYMTLCLGHPEHGYYTTKEDVLGEKGDFITSPEISQVFGELIAIWLITRWQANGSPSSVRLLELGPGRGTLMADILRTFKQFSFMAETIQTVDLVESSPVMREAQKKALEPYLKRKDGSHVQIRWFDRIEEVPVSDAYTLFSAHEFFDALPIHLLERVPPPLEPEPSPVTTSPSPENTDLSKPHFHELLVTYTPPSPAFHFTLSVEPTPYSTYIPTTSAEFEKVEIGQRIEVGAVGFGIMRRLGALLFEGKNAGGGSGLVIDYGKDGFYSESFRAFKAHAALSPFLTPGLSDLTTNVNFSHLRTALLASPFGSQIRPLGPISQADFLEQMGLIPRVDGLVRGKPDETGKRIRQGAERLVDREGMGTEYVFFGLEGKPKEPSQRDNDQAVWPFV